MKIKVGQKYKLIAPWHTHHLGTVEVIKKRKGVSDAYKGKQIFHIATDPDKKDLRFEDLDTEFMPDHFKDLEEGLKESALESYLDQKGIDNVRKLRDHGIEVVLMKNTHEDYFLKIVHDGKTNLIKIDEYDDDCEESDLPDFIPDKDLDDVE